MMKGAMVTVGVLQDAVHSRGRCAGDTDAGNVRSSMEREPPLTPSPTPQASNDALDTVFDALSHPYRRRILTRLNDHNPRDEASFSTDSVADEVDDDERVAIDVHHRHLPKLAESGFIEWDREANVVTRGPRFDEIAPLIDLMDAHRDELPAGWP